MSLCLGEVVLPGYPDGGLQCVPSASSTDTSDCALRGGLQPGQPFQPPSSALPSPERLGRLPPTASPHSKPGPRPQTPKASTSGLAPPLARPSSQLPRNASSQPSTPSPLLAPTPRQLWEGRPGCLCAPSRRARGAQRTSGCQAERSCRGRTVRTRRARPAPAHSPGIPAKAPGRACRALWGRLTAREGFPGNRPGCGDATFHRPWLAPRPHAYVPGTRNKPAS